MYNLSSFLPMFSSLVELVVLVLVTCAIVRVVAVVKFVAFRPYCRDVKANDTTRVSCVHSSIARTMTIGPCPLFALVGAEMAQCGMVSDYLPPT